MPLESLHYSADSSSLEVLDQLRLPHESVFIPVRNTQDGWNVIKKMQIRGAPIIGVVGCLSLWVEMKDIKFTSKSSVRIYVKEKLDYLNTARPTAVNLVYESKRLLKMVANMEGDDGVSVNKMLHELKTYIEGLIDKDKRDSAAIGENGADDILHRLGDKPATIVTHCNTGVLAAVGQGTALGVVRALMKRGKLQHCYCTETRPYNQGARLTTYEIVHDDIPGTLICDNMVGALMKNREVSAVIVGADRIAANGDTANKIGTYQLAVLAKHHNIPFYIAASHVSIDYSLPSGDGIPIEVRPADELTYIQGIRIAAPGISCWNPAFDVTPAELITGIITEKKVFSPMSC